MKTVMQGVVWVVLFGIGLAAHAGTVYLDYTDPQGSVLAVADTQGHILERYDYWPYGGVVSGNGPDGPGYTGHVQDPETGLIYMQQRYDDPLGRFPSPDPVGPVPGNLFSFNRYAYANNNPIVNTDPTGMCSSTDAFPCELTTFGSSGDGGGTNQQTQQQPQGSAPPPAPSGVKQVLIGLAKPVVNLLNDIAAVMGDSEASNAPALTPSNPSQAVGMMVSGVIVGAAEAAATDGDSLEITGGRTIVIGEDMAGRVIPTAKALGANVYSPPDAPPEMWMQNNKDWINQRMDEGCTILDCGAAPGRANFPNATSPYYGMELDQIRNRGYQRYQKIHVAGE